MTQCPCGGETFVDEFAWPGKPVQFFLRCAACQRVSEGSAPTPVEAESLVIEPQKVAACASA